MEAAVAEILEGVGDIIEHPPQLPFLRLGVISCIQEYNSTLSQRGRRQLFFIKYHFNL
ncbi:MAG: hypothetical protein ACLPSL_00495 [Smithella sp.]